MKIRLIDQSGPHKGRIIPIDAPEYLIGRDPACRLRIDHDQVSPRHCRILLREGRISVEDLKSASGTELNGRPIRAPIEVRHADRLRVGPASFQFAIAAGHEAHRATEERPGPRASRGRQDAEPDPATTDLDREIKHWIADRQNPDADGRRDRTEARGKRRGGEDRGTTVICPVETMLVEDDDIREFRRELVALIEAGHDRIVLDLGEVKILAPAAVDAVVQAYWRCADVGGMLKLCGLQGQAASTFSRVGPGREIPVYPDRLQALKSFRPGSAAAPDLNGLSSPVGPDDPAEVATPEQETAPDLPTLEPPIATPEQETAPDLPTLEPPEGSAGGDAAIPPRPPARSPQRVRLIAQVGRAKGRAIGIAVPRFFIGRDPCCHLRSGNPAVSRIHAVIERRGDRVLLLDFGSTNGTFLNDRRLDSNEETELSEGDRLQIGPMLFRVAIGPAPALASPHPPQVAAPPEVSAAPPPAAPSPVAPTEAPVLPTLPTILCPSCGDGAQLALDRIVGQILMTMGRALLQPGASVFPVSAPPSVWPSATTAPPADAAALPGHEAAAPTLGPEARQGPPAREASPVPPGRLGAISSAPAPAPTRAPVLGPAPGTDPDPEYDLQAVLEAATGAGGDRPTPEDPDILPLADESATAEELSPESPSPEPPEGHGTAPAHGRRTTSEISLEVECPHCGAEVKAPMGRLGQYLGCQACGAKFHIDKSGEVILGNHRPASPAVRRRRPRSSFRPSQLWESIPRRPALIAGAAGLLLFVSIRWLLSGPALPAALPDRVAGAADAFAHADRGRLLAFAAPGTSSDLDEWLTRTRPKSWDDSAGEFKIAPKIFQWNKKGKTCSFIVTIRPSGPAAPAPQTGAAAPAGPKGAPRVSLASGPSTASSGGPLTVTLHWVEDGRAGWRLDGHQTLKDRGTAPAPVIEPVAVAPPPARGRRAQMQVDQP
jgi:pSer/pThr/pTyr-binding forkhead associated (FHA) protein/anti-anti-sigma regulatory factor